MGNKYSGPNNTSPPKPHTVTDEEKHTPSQPQEHHHHQKQQQLGLGFQPSLSVDPDHNLDPAPPPPPDDLDQQTTDEELQNQQPINEELGNLQPVNDEFRNQQTVSEECRNQQPVKADEEFQNPVNQELQTQNVGGETALVAGSKDGSCTRYNYPLKPDAEDCSYYIRTGMCKFGSNCKFNHPPKMKNQAPKEKEENPDRLRHTECKEKDFLSLSQEDMTMKALLYLIIILQYFLRSGGCKFGKACRFNHSRGKIPVAPVVEFNFLGLPIRPGERECPYYMRNGSCKYESNCRFNHPDPTAVGGGDTSSGYDNGGPVSLQGASQSTISSWSPPRALNETPFVPGMFSPTQGVPSSNLEWDGYQAPVYPTPVGSQPTPPAFLNSPVDTEFYTHHKQQMLVEEFPEQPGQPESSYFLKTGDCKYRSGCKFRHPKNRMPKTATLALSDKGLPLRPDQNICSHYNRYGICKFGPACKFDHPVNDGHSDSSAVSGPDKPSPFGNSATTDCGWQ